MINNNIGKEHIFKALEWINQNGIAQGRESRKYHLKYENQFYPPKYVLSIANKFATGNELEPSEFSGGDETNSFLADLGFEIVGEKSVILATGESCNLKIATVLIQSNDKYKNESRDFLVDKTIETCGSEVGIIIFPGGTYKYNKVTESNVKEVGEKVKNYINKSKQDIIVCLGVDSNDGKDQIGIAISKDGIIAVGRKFHPAPGEEYKLNKAKTENEKEFGYGRTFEFNGYKCFLAVCYDGFGIKKQKLKNNGVNVIIDLIHAFYPKGEGGSGDVYFAKHGLAGAAKEWDCPTFGAAVFFNRQIPPNWQSGVVWNQGSLSTQKWKYEDNPLKIHKILKHDFKNENIEVRTYQI
jgi:hypothetical protein